MVFITEALIYVIVIKHVMKNKFLKGAHLSEKEVAELLRLFCQNHSASEIAQITGISRITVNAYFKMIRQKILHHLTVEVNELSKASHHLYSDNFSTSSAYVLKVHGSSVYAEPARITEQSLLVIRKLKKIDMPSFLKQYELGEFDALIDFQSQRLYITTDESGKIALVESFWSLMKSKLIQSRGINRKTLLLHVKEIEFRARFKDTDLYTYLSDLFLKRSLQVSEESKTQFAYEEEQLAV